MTYYVLPEVTTTMYTLPAVTTTVYSLPSITTTYYEVAILSVLRTWKKLGDVPARTWRKLKELGLTTWFKLGRGRYVTVYFPIDKPTTTYYEVS